MPKRKRKPLLIPLGLLAALTALLHFSGALDRLDNRLGDFLLVHESAARRPPADIVLVAIDQKSLEDEKLAEAAGSWPWPRAVHGELIDGLQAFQPKAIAFDIFFNEADRFRPESDAVLHDTAQQYDNLFFPSLLLTDGRGAPLSALPESFGVTRKADANPEATAPLMVPLVLDMKNWQGGLANFEEEKGSDRVGRFGRVQKNIEGWQLPSLAASIARYSGSPLPEQRRIRLHWYGKPPRIISYSDLFHDLGREQPQLAPSLKDAIVIVGPTAPGLNDFRPTPVNALMPGTEIITTAIANLRTQDWLRDVPARWPLSLLLIAALTLAFWRRANPATTGLALLAASLTLFVSAYFLLPLRWYVPVGAALTLSWLAYALFSTEAFLRERREREATVSLFRRFLDPRVVDDLVKTGELSRDTKPEAREITILFSDIRGFTTLSETRTPEAVVELLNAYFSQQVEVIFRHGGTLDKFIGDAIMAFWNAPADNPQHAADAVAAAIEMGEAVDRFKQELTDGGAALDAFDIGIGVHTGPAVVGFLGSDDRLDYTAIGDTVNLASRIEGCTKGVARVLVSGATRDACEKSAPDRFDFANHGEFHVKGRDQGVELLEPKKAKRT
ncbi:MAG: adenylate/guanylate cyclase domain-containing protein [Pedobacter sp.]|nr:adenylate/guanylate cyclase domain-containing protein [Pedobacter sp.]